MQPSSSSNSTFVRKKNVGIGFHIIPIDPVMPNDAIQTDSVQNYKKRIKWHFSLMREGRGHRRTYVRCTHKIVLHATFDKTMTGGKLGEEDEKIDLLHPRPPNRNSRRQRRNWNGSYFFSRPVMRHHLSNRQQTQKLLIMEQRISCTSVIALVNFEIRVYQKSTK